MDWNDGDKRHTTLNADQIRVGYYSDRTPGEPKLRLVSGTWHYYNEMTWWELDDREMQRVGKVTLTGAPFSVGVDVAIKDEGSWH